MMNTKAIEKLKEEAKSKEISLSELCRQKLRGSSQLDRIEEKVDRLREY